VSMAAGKINEWREPWLEAAPLARADLALPRVGLGTAAIGNLFSPVSDAEAGDMLAAALARGLRYFDTAPLYGHGLAEQRLAGAVRGTRRDQLILSSKVGRLLRPGAPLDETQHFEGEPFYKQTPPLGPVWDFSYEGVMASVAESCERIGVERLDMLLLHDPDDHFAAACGPAYEALKFLRATGMTRAIGAGMNHTPVLTQLVQECQLDVALVAGRYTLLDQSALADLLPACLARGTSVVVGGAFNSGVLAGPTAGARYNYVPAPAAVRQKAERLEAVCARYGVALPAAALQFPLAHPAVSSVLIGCRSAAELELDLSWLQVKIPPALWADLRAEGLLPLDAPVPTTS